MGADATTAQALITKWRERALDYKTDHTLGSVAKSDASVLEDCADELEAALASPAVPPQDLQRIRAEAAMVALETVKASGYYLHHRDGHIASREEVIAVGAKALDAAMGDQMAENPRTIMDDAIAQWHFIEGRGGREYPIHVDTGTAAREALAHLITYPCGCQGVAAQCANLAHRTGMSPLGRM